MFVEKKNPRKIEERIFLDLFTYNSQKSIQES